MACTEKTLPLLNTKHEPALSGDENCHVLIDPGMIPRKPGFYVTHRPSSILTTEIQVYRSHPKPYYNNGNSVTMETKCDSVSQSATHSLTHSLTHIFSQSVSQSVTHSLTHSVSHTTHTQTTLCLKAWNAVIVSTLKAGPTPCVHLHTQTAHIVDIRLFFLGRGCETSTRRYCNQRWTQRLWLL
jgi:hypothetical protein